MSICGPEAVQLDCVLRPEVATVLNWAHIHLMLTHIPVIGVGLILAFFLMGAIRRSRVLEWASLQMFVALAVLSISVYLTGSRANHQMREISGVSRDTIRQHSSVADFAFWAMEALTVLSLGAPVKFRNSAPIPSRFVFALLALALVVIILMVWTANLGGKIRHPEIGASSAIQRISAV